MTHKTSRCLALALAWSAGAAGAADDGRSFDVGGLVFGDAYYVPDYHDEEHEDAGGVVMRRAYLTFDAGFAEWFARLRFEANQSGEFEVYEADDQIKDLYVGRKFGAQKVVAGLGPTPTFDLIENFWGARYLARTPMDLQGVASRDTGLAVSGPISEDGSLAYRVMLAPGVDFESDSSDGRKAMAALSWRARDRWVFDLYADYEKLPGSADRRILQGFMGYETGDFRFGLQYSNQDRRDDPPLELASAFFVADLGSRSSVILRADHLFEPSPRGDDISYLPFDPSARATMLIAGLEFRFGELWRVTPNVVVKRYGHDDAGERPDTDVHLRLTVFLDLE